ncbi:MAG: helix-turn-helix domain-containing protein [Bacteroidia bacterium]|nr:helix-turn-helix domain-containing protein [Bacteroidia bacterium]
MDNNTKFISDKLDEVLELLKAPKQLMNIEQLSQYISMSKSAIYKLTSTHQIPFYRPSGKIIFFEKAEVDKWMRRNRVRSMDEIREQVENW